VSEAQELKLIRCCWRANLNGLGEGTDCICVDLLRCLRRSAPWLVCVEAGTSPRIDAQAVAAAAAQMPNLRSLVINQQTDVLGIAEFKTDLARAQKTFPGLKVMVPEELAC
jgi:hypothetical protein